MGKFLVIVESPTKAKTINKYLGNDYIVKSSFGHIRDLPTHNDFKKGSLSFLKNKNSSTFNEKDMLLVHRMGIDPYNGWVAKYEILPGKEKIVNELSILAKRSEHIYLATDLDREGEAIAWHLREVMQINTAKVSRVIFNEITFDAITQAFRCPTVLNINKFYAQQARRFMDRLVGYMLSPLLWKKVARGLSAGRVQSVVVRLIVERERKIKNFCPKEYWKLHVDFSSHSGEHLIFQVVRHGKSRFVPTRKEHVQKVQDALLNFVPYVITNRMDERLIVRSDPPFITSSLQRAANLRFGYTTKKTMLLAQRLYESGYITYMRTNSTNVSKKALKLVRSYICDVFGKEYLPKTRNKYVSKSFVREEAHEAIRPSNIYLLTEMMEDIEDIDVKKLYNMIWCQFIASQMKPSQYVIRTLFIEANNFQLRARSRFCCFDGWKKVMSKIFNDNMDEEKEVFSNVKIGDVLILNKFLSTQHFTKAPNRYSEASLIKELDKRGIGRPSTYVSIISTIRDRGYVYFYNSHFYATKIGEIVTDRLFESFYELMDYEFTANMESILDKIASNKEEWKSVLDNFFIKLRKKLDIAEQDIKDGGMRPNSIVITSIICSLCGKKMGIRTATTGVFLSCEGYDNVATLKNRCKNTMNLIPDIIDGIDIQKESCFHCKQCNSVMDRYFLDDRRKLHVCINSPSCTGYIIENGVFFIKGPNNLVVRCEKCMDDMSLKFGRFGRYMSCNNLDCKHTQKVFSDRFVECKKSFSIPFPELLCKKSDAHFVLRNGKLGIFLAANTFPKSRETRAPLVEELVRFRNRLPKQLLYLADAPICDDDGNKTLVCFDRNKQEQYIVSEQNGKFTNWKLFYIHGTWKIVDI